MKTKVLLRGESFTVLPIGTSNQKRLPHSPFFWSIRWIWDGTQWSSSNSLSHMMMMAFLHLKEETVYWRTGWSACSRFVIKEVSWGLCCCSFNYGTFLWMLRKSGCFPSLWKPFSYPAMRKITFRRIFNYLIWNWELLVDVNSIISIFYNYIIWSGSLQSCLTESLSNMCAVFNHSWLDLANLCPYSTFYQRNTSHLSHPFPFLSSIAIQTAVCDVKWHSQWCHGYIINFVTQNMLIAGT